MPADVFGGFITYLEDQLDVVFWEGEVPREGVDGIEINCPVFRFVMPESGFVADWTFEDTFSDNGSLTLQFWHTGMATLHALIVTAEALLVNSANWPAINVGLADGYEVYKLLRTRWYEGQVLGARTKNNEYLYRGELDFDCSIRGALDTR